jgi:hypothetical protein
MTPYEIKSIVLNHFNVSNTHVLEDRHFYGPRLGREALDVIDGVVNVDGSVKLISNLKKLPVQFGKIFGDFDISNRELTSLKGSPYHVDGYFNCENNCLTSLDHGPKIVRNNYFATLNDFDDLNGLPEDIGGYLRLDFNEVIPVLKLVSFKCAHFIEQSGNRNSHYLKIGYMVNDAREDIASGVSTLKQAIWKLSNNLIEHGFEKNARY